MTRTTAYRSAVAVAIGTALMLVWLMGAVGVIGIEGDRADLMFLGVLAMGLSGMVATLFAGSAVLFRRAAVGQASPDDRRA